MVKRKKIRPKKNESTVLIVLKWLVPVVVIFVILHYVSAYDQIRARIPAWESRAKSTLRSCGGSQLAYQGVNDLQSYGSFNALLDTLYIDDRYTLGNMIESYSMSWEISSSQPVQSGNSKVYDQFTIIAVPTHNQKYLHTFAVTEDQIVRVYEPGHDNDFNSIKTWEPIL